MHDYLIKVRAPLLQFHPPKVTQEVIADPQFHIHMGLEPMILLYMGLAEVRALKEGIIIADQRLSVMARRIETLRRHTLEITERRDELQGLEDDADLHRVESLSQAIGTERDHIKENTERNNQ